MTQKKGFLNGIEFFGIKPEVLKAAEEKIKMTEKQGFHTYRQCFFEFFHEKQKYYMTYGKSPQTLADIENCNRIFVLADDLPYETIADVYIENISAARLKELKRDIEQHNSEVKRPNKRKGKEDLSHKRLNSIYCWIDIVFKYAYDRGYVSKDLIDNIGLTAYQGVPETNKHIKRNFFTENEFKLFDSTYDQYSEEIFAKNFKLVRKGLGDLDVNEYVIFKSLLFKSFFYTAFYTGLRKSEIRGLKWSDLFPSEIPDLYFVRVDKQFSDKCTAFVNKPDHTRLPKTKSSVRICFIHQCCYEVLRQLRLYLASRNLFDEEQYIFYDFYLKAPKPIPATNLDRHFQKILDKTGIIENSLMFNGEERNITIHGMRHAACTMLLEKGMRIEDVARFLGHKDTKMVENVYREYVCVDCCNEQRILEGAKFFKK